MHKIIFKGVILSQHPSSKDLENAILAPNNRADLFGDVIYDILTERRAHDNLNVVVFMNGTEVGTFETSNIRFEIDFDFYTELAKMEVMYSYYKARHKKIEFTVVLRDHNKFSRLNEPSAKNNKSWYNMFN